MTDQPEISLLSLVLTLRPEQAVEAVPHVGRAAHAILLDAISWADPKLADEVHAGADVRPFTVSDLMGYSPQFGVKPEHTYALRLTTLTAATSQAVLSATSKEQVGPLSVGSTIDLAGILMRIESIAPDLHSALRTSHSALEQRWASATSYEELSAPWLLARKNPEARIMLNFASPTTFRSEGRNVPVPLPKWVFGSLLEKWNAFASIAFPPELRRYVDECLALGSYRLKTRTVALKEGGLRVGAIGTARYTATNRDRYWLSLINLLADFAFFAGVGAGTTMGLGQARRIVDERSLHGKEVQHEQSQR